jgi:hypothetical protein
MTSETVRLSFVQHFGEEAAVKIEEASLGHQNDDPMNHANDNWGDDPFQYHLMNAISHECLGRWAKWHGIDLDEAEVKRWCLEYGNLHDYNGDVPDYIAFFAGAYGPWINWERAGTEIPEAWAGFEDDQKEFHALNEEERLAALQEMTQKAMKMLDIHNEEGPL